jgi:hypothetical protein
MPVNTIAMPAASAAAMTSLSRIDPPGWMTEVTPASAAASSPSANGKKASEASTEPIEQQIGNFALARRPAGHRAQPVAPGRDPVSLLDENATGHGPKNVARSGRVGHLPGDEKA